MPLTIRCPNCGKELVAPDELVGKVAACPQCKLTFPVTGSARWPVPPMTVPPMTVPPKTVPQMSAPLGPPLPPADPAPARGAAHLGGSSTIVSAPIATNVPPAASAAVPRPGGDPRDSAMPPATPAPSSRPELRPPKPSSSVSPASANGSSASSVVVPRAVNSARFIAANPTERRIDLGADGRLPELILQEGGNCEQAATADRSGNPLVLIAVLTISFGLSAAMLFIDTGTRRSESDGKSAARQELTLHYTQSHRRLEPYQELLRQALQFHNQGKYADELRCYRRVLDLLHEEHRENLKGLTGVRRGELPPSDEHLESLLSQLLSND